MPTEPPFPDTNNPEGFYLIKTETRDEIGNRNSDNKAFDYFDEKDVGVVQSTALIQPLNSAEFIPTPGVERETMTKGLNSANFGGLEAQSLQFIWGGVGSAAGMTPINITWTYDNSSTATILNSEKEFGQQMTNYFNGNATDGSNAHPFFDSIQNISFSDLITSSSPQANFPRTQFGADLKKLFGQAIPEINDTNDLSVIIQIFNDIASGQKSFSLAVGQVTSLTNIATENIIDSINKMYGSSFSDQDAVLQDSTKFIQNFFDASQKFDLLKKDLELIIGPAFSSETFWPEFQKFVLGSDVYDSLSQSEINDFKINLISGFLKNQSDISGLFETISTGLSFTGLMDTPTGFESGKFLVANETGLEWTDIEDPVLSFTGLSDTPTGYNDGKILQSTTTGLAWVDMPVGGGTPDSVDDITDLPDNPADGQLVTVGCDLYIGCNGEWVKVGADAVAPPSEAPACVSNLEEYNQYTEYKDQFLADNSSASFSAGLNNQTNIHDFVHDVCLFADSNLNQERNTVVIDETTFKWGMFAGDQNINIRAQAFSGPNIGSCTFKEWRSDLPNFPKTNAQETVFIDRDASITGYFECTLAPDQPNCNQVALHLQPDTGETIADKSDNQHTVTTVGDTVVDNTATLFGGGTMNFDGAGDYLNMPHSDLFNFGADDFTVEMWINFRTTTQPDTGSIGTVVMSHGDGLSSSDWGWMIYGNNGNLSLLAHTVGGSNWGSSIAILDSITTNRWYHVAVSKKAGMIRAYVDGVARVHSHWDITPHPEIQSVTQQLIVGKSHLASRHHFDGQIQDFRISKKAVYTGNFTPPTNLLANPCGFPGDQPTCSEIDFHLQASLGGTVEDKSDNNRTITNPNNVSNQSFIDNSETLFGESTLFFSTSRLLHFYPANFGSNDFTVEFWIKYDSPITTSTKDIIVTKGRDPTPTIELSIALNQDKLRLLNNLVLESTNTGMASVLNNWTHIAAVRSGNSIYLYVNGQREIDVAINGSVYASPYELEIGNKSSSGGWTNNLKHMQDFRISKKAVYTSNFVPAAALLDNPC